jgi:tripartite-type tricarboxylate transporter receptor subunit TctC
VAFAQAVRDPGVSAKLRGMAVTPGGNSSEEFRAMIDKDIESYTQVVKAANLKFE